MAELNHGRGSLLLYDFHQLGHGGNLGIVPEPKAAGDNPARGLHRCGFHNNKPHILGPVSVKIKNRLGHQAFGRPGIGGDGRQHKSVSKGHVFYFQFGVERRHLFLPPEMVLQTRLHRQSTLAYKPVLNKALKLRSRSNLFPIYINAARFICFCFFPI
jgi:hypothetical protein